MNNSLNLIDFGIIGDQLPIGELLHSSYKRGKDDVIKEIEADFQKNLQSAAQSSSLLKSKLNEQNIEVKDMYLKVDHFSSFKCLVILAKNDYYDKTKRRKAYSISEEINKTNNQIELDFSIMSFSKMIEVDNITSDGFILKYGS
ncbi:hypothetical protein NBT05_04220 [Aquimarina sp. ERC-38]|uniref:hypothetical protein n=1 Tax=Aquimarina sp. ERC-38 TaxID=2949996 RepID=UPI0022484E36|nr:hypothetical protein [Aquimarina sp. ERC-38]UZO81681.1 hypothetical protein NBT05_04220 [Aquimarina sp. ERC-38]